MISVPVRKLPHRKRDEQVNFWADKALLQMIEDLKKAHPKMGKGEIIREAVRRWHEVEFR